MQHPPLHATHFCNHVSGTLRIVFRSRLCLCCVCYARGMGNTTNFFPFHFSGIFLCSLFSLPSLASCCNYKVVVVVAAVVVVVAAAAAMRFQKVDEFLWRPCCVLMSFGLGAFTLTHTNIVARTYNFILTHTQVTSRTRRYPHNVVYTHCKYFA